jgi:hypothetical protein
VKAKALTMPARHRGVFQSNEHATEKADKMTNSKNDALAQVASAADQLHATNLLFHSSDRNTNGVLRGDARKAAQSAAAQAAAAARRAGATTEEIRASRDD